MPPEELDHLIGRVEAEATRMGLLVEDLLTLARLDQQRPLNLAPVDLLTLAADAVQDARIVSPGRPIDLVVAPGTAFLVDGDEQRLRQVLGNLVNNAITHTPAGTPIRVKIGAGTLPSARTGSPAVRHRLTELDLRAAPGALPVDGRRRPWCLTSRTTVPACPPSRRSGCSSGSTEPTRRGTGRPAGPGSGWPSWPGW